MQAAGRFIDPDGVKPSDDLGILIVRRLFHIRAVKLDHLRDLAADGIDGIERGGGFLKNVGNPASSHAAKFCIGGFQKILPFKENLPSLINCRRAR